VMSTEHNEESGTRTVGAVAATPSASGTAADASAVGAAGPLPSSGASPQDAMHRGNDHSELAVSLTVQEAEVAAAAAGEPGLKRRRIKHSEELGDWDEVGEDAPKVSATQVPGWEKIKICWAPPGHWRTHELWVSKDATAADVKYELEPTTGWRGKDTCLVGMRTHNQLFFSKTFCLQLRTIKCRWSPGC